MYAAQAELFEEIPHCGRARLVRRKACAKGFEDKEPVQLCFDLVARIEAEEEDDPLITAPVSQRTVPAAQAEPIAIKCPSSVWGLAAMPITIKTKAAEAKKIHRKVVDTGKGFRAVRIMESETQEYKDREEARRAKQTPPKPCKAMRTTSKRFKDLIGE